MYNISRCAAYKGTSKNGVTQIQGGLGPTKVVFTTAEPVSLVIPIKKKDMNTFADNWLLLGLAFLFIHGHCLQKC